MLATDWKVSSEVWSATSYAELAREAREAERHNRLEPLDVADGNEQAAAANR